MNMYEVLGRKPSIADTIKYYREALSEICPLRSDPNLITVDGPDGIGKSTICRLLVAILKEKYGQDRVILVSPTSFMGSEGSDRLKLIRDRKIGSWKREKIDNLYLANMNRFYNEVIIPALNAGKIVVVDRSEVDSLRFAYEYYAQRPELIEKRQRAIARGQITHGLWAGVRIFISNSAEGILNNLQGKADLSQNDPQNLVEVRKRIAAQKMAEDQILGIPFHGEVKVIKAENPSVSEDMIENHLLDLVRKLIIYLLDERVID